MDNRCHYSSPAFLAQKRRWQRQTPYIGFAVATVKIRLAKPFATVNCHPATVAQTNLFMTSTDLKTLLSQAAATVLATPPADEEASQLQSVIGMVSTLITDGKSADLAGLLAVHFPAYFMTPPPLVDYPPISRN